MNLRFGPLLVPLILAFGHLLETRAFAPGRTPPGTFLNKAAGATGRGSSSSWGGKPLRLPPNLMTTHPKENNQNMADPDVKERLRGVEKMMYEQGIKLSEFGANISNLVNQVEELKKEATDNKEELKNEIKENKEELKNEIKETKTELKNEIKETKEELIKKIEDNFMMYLIFNTILFVFFAMLFSNDEPTIDVPFKFFNLFKK